QPCGEQGAAAGQFRVGAVEPPESSCRGVRPPVRRAKPLHAPAFLIDQHQEIFSASSLAYIRDQRSDLLGIFDIPPEENETGWPGAGKEVTFCRCEGNSLDTANKGILGH